MKVTLKRKGSPNYSRGVLLSRLLKLNKSVMRNFREFLIAMQRAKCWLESDVKNVISHEKCHMKLFLDILSSFFYKQYFFSSHLAVFAWAWHYYNRMTEIFFVIWVRIALQ